MNFSSSKRKIVNNTRNTYVLGQNTSKYCSQIIVVHVHATFFSKTIMVKYEVFTCFKTLRCYIYHADKCKNTNSRDMTVKP